MKALLETTGDFQLVDPHGGQMVGAIRPHVVNFSGFFGQRHALSQVKIICGSLNDAATDEEFAEYVKGADGDMPLAIEAFLAAFNSDLPGVDERLAGTEPEPVEIVKPTRKGR